MRARFLVCALAIMALGFGGAISADTLTIIDHFDNPADALNTTTWAPWSEWSTTPTPTVASSIVTASAGSKAWSGIDSRAVYGEGTYEFKYAGGNGTQIFGLEDALTGATFAQVSNKYSAGWALTVNTGSGGNHNGAVFAAPAVGDIFDLAWSATGFELTKVGVGVVSSVTVPITQQLSLCTMAQTGSSVSLDYVGTVGAPEPSSLALLSAGLVGLLAYAWKKRR